MLDALLNLAGGGVLGGLVGLLGTWLKGREERAKQTLEYDHQRAMREIDLREMEREAELRLRQTATEIEGKAQVASIEAEVAREVAASAVQEASYQHDRATYGGGKVDKLRGSMRPLITLYLLAIMSLIAYRLYAMEAMAGVEAEQAWELFSSVVRDIVFLSVTAVTWWFGSRPNSRR